MIPRQLKLNNRALPFLLLFFFPLSLWFYPPPAFANGLEIKTGFEKEWSAKHKELMNKAAKIVFERMPSTEIAQCSKRNSWRGEPSRAAWGRFMGIIRRQEKLTLTISKETYASDIIAMASVGVAKVNKRGDEWKNLRLTLNEKSLDRSRHSKEHTSIEFWAKVIAHELGHTMGLRHGSGGSWEDNYAGYFITEMGYCVMTAGKYGSDMGNYERKRWRQKHFKLKNLP